MEYYAGITTDKEEYFSEKLTQLFTKKQVMNVINSKSLPGEVMRRPKKKSGATMKKLLSSKFSLPGKCGDAIVAI